MNKTSTKLHVAAVMAGLVSLSGCQLLFRAAKGEMTPVGVTQASSGDVSRLISTVASSSDPHQFTKAFTDLTSVYMYKCMDPATLAPKEGKSEIREAAGDGLVAAMKDRARSVGTDDPLLDAAAGDIAALEGKMTKCDADKRAKQDPAGQFPEAVKLASRAGREEYMNGVASSLDAELQAALGQGPDQVFDWAKSKCGNLLPVWSYCVPRAVEAFYSQGDWLSIGNVFLAQGGAEGAKILPALGAKVGNDKLVEEVRGFMMSGKAAEVTPTGLDLMASYLADNGKWGSCDDRKGLLRSTLTSESTNTSRWAIEKIVEDKCRNMDSEIIKALGSDSPWVREKAAWATGELNIQKAKKHVGRLRYSDPYTDEGCWCNPVRDAAANAYNKLELASDEG